MEKLELKHVVGYLPYGLKVIHTDFEPMEGKFTSEAEVETMSNECVTFKNSFYAHSDYYFGDLEIEIKPILRPLSDLTKEIEFNGEKFVPLDVLNNMLFTKHSSLEYYSSEHCNGAILFSTNISGFNILSMNEKIQKLLEWNFDIHGLIEKGLAIDINTI